MQCKMFGGILGLYPLDTRSRPCPQGVTNKNVPLHCQMPLGEFKSPLPASPLPSPHPHSLSPPLPPFLGLCSLSLGCERYRQRCTCTFTARRILFSDDTREAPAAAYAPNVVAP